MNSLLGERQTSSSNSLPHYDKHAQLYALLEASKKLEIYTSNVGAINSLQVEQEDHRL